MGRIEVELEKYHREQDADEKRFAADDLSEVDWEEVSDAFSHISHIRRRELMEAIREQDNLDAGETFLEIIRDYRRLG